MGNELADAIREVLRTDLIAEYGALELAAEALGIPYKTLYRALTSRGKDRSQSVKLDLVLDIARHLEERGRSTFATVYARADMMTDNTSPTNVAPFRPRTANVVTPEDTLDYVDAPDLDALPHAAKRGVRKADQEPWAE